MRYKLLLPFVLLSLSFSACAPNKTATTQSTEQTQKQEQTATPTATPSETQKEEPTEAESQKYVDFTAEKTDGKATNFSEYVGKGPVVVNFWASWCPPCKEEMPDFLEASKEYKEKGVTFVMVNLTDGEQETKELANKFLQEEKLDFENILYDTKMEGTSGYVGRGIPVTAIIDSKGTITFYRTGMMDKKTLADEIEKLL